MGSGYPKTITRILIASLALYIASAIFSDGFHHYDEHFQIYEFANYKLGATPKADLPWEFHSKIRPWFQPAILCGLIKWSHLLGIESPFTWALLFRILSACLGWMATVSLILCCFGWFQKKQQLKWAILSTAFVWYLPYLYARTSSESWSGSLFLIGFCQLIRIVQKRLSGEKRLSTPWQALAMAGMFMGLAFHCRYQIGICIAAGMGWIFAFGRFNKKELLTLGFSLSISLLIGMGIDAWGYGEWVLAPWNYFQANIIEGKASQWGVSPWYAYLTLALVKAIPPMSLALVGGLIASWILKPKFSLTWITLPFVFIHSLIPHKELRFLFPIAPLLPLLFCMTVAKLSSHPKPWSQRVLNLVHSKGMIYTTVAVNLVALLIASFRPLRTELAMYQEVYDSNVSRLYYRGENPYRLAGLSLHYYRRPELKLSPVDEGDLPSRPYWLYSSAPSSSMDPNCSVRYRSFPSWLERETFQWISHRIRLKKASLYYCI